jgi:hypothetical protein
MVTRMTVEIEIADALLAEATRVAAEEDTTIEALVEDGLRSVLDARQERKPFKLRDGSFRGQGRGLKPEFENADWDKMRGAIYEGHGA